MELEGLQLPPVGPSAAAEEEARWAALEQEATELEVAGRWTEAAAAWRRLYTLAWRRHYEQLRSLQMIAQQEALPPERTPLSLQEEKVRLAALGVRPVARLPHAGRGIIDLAFSPNGELLTAGADDGRVFLWKTESSHPHLILEGHTEAVNAVAFSPDGTLVASASADQTVRLWSARLGWEVQVLERHGDWATGVAFSPDGTLLGSCSYDGTVWLWLLVEGGA